MIKGIDFVKKNTYILDILFLGKCWVYRERVCIAVCETYIQSYVDLTFFLPKITNKNTNCFEMKKKK